MKAIVFNEHGGPDVLKYVDAPTSVIAANEVLVRVKACALNHLDLWVRRGLPGIKFQFPHIPGSDIAGEVAEVGNLVSDVKVGERVLLAPGLSCGRCVACAAGADNRCRKYTLFGYLADGGCAEFVKSPAANIIPIPTTMKFEEAAAIPVVFLTAWHMLITRAQVQPGEDVLVLAAGSGVGVAAIQIAKLAGARVITTASTDAKLAKARELGADEVINHSEKDVLCLAQNGRLVTCGATTGYNGKFDLRYLYSRNLSLLGSFMGSRSELYTVLKLVVDGKLRPIIDRAMPLAECARAHELLELREQFGKIVLAVQ